METCLKEIIVGSTLQQLKEKGYINSYEDENTEEVFLTEDSKEYIKNMKDLD
jgi:DNA-binding MarR family transcriptional regulator